MICNVINKFHSHNVASVKLLDLEIRSTLHTSVKFMFDRYYVGWGRRVVNILFDLLLDG